MKTWTTLSLLIFTVILTGCDETKKVIDVAGNVQLSGNYTVTVLNGKNVTGTAPTFSLSALDNSFRGTTGCNSVFGNYTIDLYAISFSDLAVSERYCAESEIMQQERDFLNALKNTGSYELQNNVVTFYSRTDRSVLLKAAKESKN